MKHTTLLIPAILIATLSFGQGETKTMLTVNDTSTISITFKADLVVSTQHGMVCYNTLYKGLHYDISILKSDSISSYANNGKWIIKDTINTILALNEATTVCADQSKRAWKITSALMDVVSATPNTKKYKKAILNYRKVVAQ